MPSGGARACTPHVHAAGARQDNFPPGVLCLIGAARDPGELIGGKIHFIALIVRRAECERKGCGGRRRRRKRRIRGRTSVNAERSSIGEKYIVDHRGRAPAARLTSARYTESPFRRYFRNYTRQTDSRGFPPGHVLSPLLRPAPSRPVPSRPRGAKFSVVRSRHNYTVARNHAWSSPRHVNRAPDVSARFAPVNDAMLTGFIVRSLLVTGAPLIRFDALNPAA